jgi:hypothetical protein
LYLKWTCRDFLSWFPKQYNATTLHKTVILY